MGGEGRVGQLCAVRICVKEGCFGDIYQLGEEMLHSRFGIHVL